MARKILSGWVLAVLGCAVAVGAAELVAPAPVSPGSGQQVETVPGSWPTFSWGAVAEASGYRLVVYEVTAEGELGRAVIRQALAAGASSWSPPLRQGLEPGGSYAWTVGAVSGRGKTAWSEPALFRVAPGPGERELEEALAVVRRYWALEADGARELEATSPKRGARPAEARGKASVSSPDVRAPAGTELSVEGNVDAGSFSGTGSLLTELDPGNLSPGTAAIDISGTAATASDLVGAACVSESELDFDPATQAEMAASLASYYTQTDLQGDGSAAVHWNNLTDVPPNVADTTSGDAVAREIVKDKKAWVDGQEVTGTRVRFQDNGDGTVTDTATDLVWLKNANCFWARPWSNADADAAGLAPQACGLAAGAPDDWRLPHLGELWSLIDLHYTNPALSNAAGTAKWLEGDAFVGVQSDNYWSATENGSYTAWFVNFSDGLVNYVSKGFYSYVWPVRGGQ